MKKTILSTLVILAAAGCTKTESLNDIKPAGSDITIYAQDINALKSRTSVDNKTYEVSWTAGDKIAVFTWKNGENLPTSIEDWSKGNPVKFTTEAAGSDNIPFIIDEQASDAGKVEVFRDRYNPGAALDWYVVYPGFMQTPSEPGKSIIFFGKRSDMDVSQHGNDNTAHLALQDVLFGQTLNTREPGVSMQHIGALQQVTVENTCTEEITVKSITMTTTTAKLSGKFRLHLTDKDNPFDPSDAISSSNEFVLDVTDGTPIPSGNSAKFYFVTAPFTLKADEKITITVFTEKGEFSQTITALDKEFKAGHRYNANFSLSDKTKAKEILRGATLEKIKKADVWHYNEYRGGKYPDNYPHFDWSSDYMGTFTSWYGSWEEQNEGTTLRIRNSESDQTNPADLKNFDSYLCGIKDITEDNKILSIKMRTHNADDASPANWGVQVIDLSAAEPKAELIGGIRYYGSSNYTNPDESFDLSDYVGKKVAVVIGIFRAETGNYYKQVVLRRLAFGPSKLTTADEWSYLPGNAVSGLDPGYKMTQEIVRSTMPVTEFSSFTGISPVKVSNDNYRDAYKTWRPAGHFAAWWSCMPVQKDSEPFAGQGYVLKTRGGGTTVSTTAPEAYFYAKFAIAEGHNKIELNCRTFSSDYATFFKLTAITEDCGTVETIIPAVSGTTGANQANDGCMKLKHERGSANSPEDYAHFTYDLSEFNGKNVVVALAVFKGEANDKENKLSIHSINVK